MKTLVSLICYLFLSAHSFAVYNEGVWPVEEGIAGVFALSLMGKKEHKLLFRADEVREWTEVDAILKRKLNDPNAMHTAEYSVYRNWFVTAIIWPAHFFTRFDADPKSPHYYIDSKGRHFGLEPEFSEANPYVNLIQPSTATVNCLLLGPDGSGCGDLFQGGVTDDELVCYRSKTYFSCQLACTGVSVRSLPVGRCATAVH